MSKIEPKYKDHWNEVTGKTYAQQAQGFLNAYWDELGPSEGENIWKYVQTFQKIDKRGKTGNDLDEFEAHKFLESLGETLTVIALRERLRTIDVDNNNRMALMEYLIFKYSKPVVKTITAPQSDNKKELDEAQEMVNNAQLALVDMETKLQEQKKAEAENKAALDELHKQEEDYKNRIAALERATQEGTVVQKNKAANELAQLKGEDPLPLRKAKISQESTVRKAEKARKALEEATALAQKRFDDAQKYLDEVKAKGGGSAQGSLWWIQREITEAKKYLPKSKQ